MEWFCYDDSGSPYNPLNYNLCTIPNCPDPNQRLCAIFANRQLIDNIARPIITTTLQTLILAAQTSLNENPLVLLKPL